jgi:hypothetical protein
VERPRDIGALMTDAPPEAVALTKALLQFNPTKRPDVQQCLDHPYMAQFRTGQVRIRPWTHPKII